MTHPRLQDALHEMFGGSYGLFPDRDGYRVVKDGNTLRLAEWNRTDPIPTMEQIESALAARDARLAAENLEKEREKSWAISTRDNWSTLTANEKDLVLLKVFRRVFAKELSSS